MGRTFRTFKKDKNRWEYLSCRKKKKFKSSEASKLADRWGQRKYECHICRQWHLTKMKGTYE